MTKHKSSSGHYRKSHVRIYEKTVDFKFSLWYYIQAVARRQRTLTTE